MPRKLTPPEPWWHEAADLMVRCNLSLRQAAAELGIDLTIEEAENTKDRKLFQKALDEARTTYYTEIGTNPRLSKDLVVGQVYKLAEKLAQEGESYKATDALLKLAKIRGWVGNEPDSFYDLFKDLTQKDLDELKKGIIDQLDADSQPATTESRQETAKSIN